MKKPTKWARAEWDCGRSRFVPLLDITYIWLLPRFTGYLALGRHPNPAIGRHLKPGHRG